MPSIFSFIIGNIKTIGITIIAFFSVYILRKNRSLSIENNNLTQENIQKAKILDIQTKVIDASSSVKATDIDANIKRMQDGKL